MACGCREGQTLGVANEEPFFVLTDVPSIASLAARPLPDDFRRFLRWIEQIGGGLESDYAAYLGQARLRDPKKTLSHLVDRIDPIGTLGPD